MEEVKDTAAKRQKAAAWEPSEQFRLILAHIQTLPWPLTDWATYRESTADFQAVVAAFKKGSPDSQRQDLSISRQLRTLLTPEGFRDAGDLRAATQLLEAASAAFTSEMVVAQDVREWTRAEDATLLLGVCSRTSQHM